MSNFPACPSQPQLTILCILILRPDCSDFLFFQKKTQSPLQWLRGPREHEWASYVREPHVWPQHPAHRHHGRRDRIHSQHSVHGCITLFHPEVKQKTHKLRILNTKFLHMKSAEASVVKNRSIVLVQLCVFVIKYYSAVCVDFYLLYEYISFGLFMLYFIRFCVIVEKITWLLFHFCSWNF